MLASSCLADINGGAKNKQDKEKQEAEAFCSQLHPSVCIYWLWSLKVGVCVLGKQIESREAEGGLCGGKERWFK